MTRTRYAMLVAALALAVAACGGTTTDTTEGLTETTEAPTGDTTTTSPSDTTDTTAPAETTTTAGASGELGSLQESLGATNQATSGRMEGQFEMVGLEGVPGGGPIVMTFTGEFDNTAELFGFQMDMSEALGGVSGEIPPEMLEAFGDLTMEVRQIGETTYMRFPFFSFLGVETEWVSMPTEEGAGAEDLTGAAPTNPTDFLGTFEDADAEVEELGTETVRGIETTHYSVLIDTDALVENATPEELEQLEAQGPLPEGGLPMEVWVGDDGLVYRYQIVYDGTAVEAAPGEGFEEMTMTFEMFDYGTDVSIDEPPADQVTDSEQLGGLFDGGFGG